MRKIAQLVDHQMREWDLRHQTDLHDSQHAKGPVISISRDLGCGARKVAETLSTRLNCQILGRDTIDYVSEDLHAQRRLVDLLDEHGRKTLENWVDGYLHGAPVEYDEYGKSLVKVVRSAALKGGVILLGRGSNFILGLHDVFCVRLVAPLEVRVRRLMDYNNLEREAAVALIAETDDERNRFIKRLFGRDVNDPLAYHLTLNLGEFELSDAVEIILDSMKPLGFLTGHKPSAGL